jgi:hypothetical protein
MSGGHYDYVQFRMDAVAEELAITIRNNNVPDEWGYATKFSPETIKVIQDALQAVKRAACYVHHVDLLVSGDTGEDTFHADIVKELAKMEEIPE